MPPDGIPRLRSLLGAWPILGLACNPVVQPPDTWPSDGCTWSAQEKPAKPGPVRRRRLAAEDGPLLQLAWRRPRARSCTGVVVFVPPGFEAGLDWVQTAQAEDVLTGGHAVVAWDPRGRGESEGKEDSNGPIGQADLAALLRWAAAEPSVDPDRVVVLSRSLGGALAAGALAQHGDLDPRAWVDIESPGFLQADLDHAPARNRETLEALADPDDPDWWHDRSPAEQIPGVSTPYDRVQGLPDHALGDYLGHARAMVDRAEASPAVHYNGERVTGPLGEDGVREGAVAGGVAPTAGWIGRLVLERVEGG